MIIEDKVERAISLYREASVCEREGRLGDALAKFRQATRIVHKEPDIDRIIRNRTHYEQRQQRHHRLVETEGEKIVEKKNKSAVSSDGEEDLQAQNYYTFGTVEQDTPLLLNGNSLANGMAALLLPDEEYNRVPTDSRFNPKNQAIPTPISKLPSEIITHLIRWSLVLDFSSLPEIASTCKYFHHQTLTQALWRWLCRKHYTANNILNTSVVMLNAQLAQKYRKCWLTLWIEKPRPSLEGYLRLFADGSMLLWTTSVEPSKALKDLNGIMEIPNHTYSLELALGRKKNLSKKEAREKAASVAALKGLLFGSWRLEDDVLVMNSTVDGVYWILTPISPVQAQNPKDAEWCEVNDENMILPGNKVPEWDIIATGWLIKAKIFTK
ncbi:hypothetical protein HK100_005456 [Physocladia obscura]|uniref:F-box domain-containing protein n=1 Tax=Physocladia obscura TaxID=109957 RepID=A0AAD5T6J6_9FUNG|nr:hypothetical protein HK100_005456 [Physocladia obscura]